MRGLSIHVDSAVGLHHDHNVNAEPIANLETTEQCKGLSIQASVAKDGKFTVTNARNHFSKTYTAR